MKMLDPNAKTRAKAFTEIHDLIAIYHK
jgi:hypothetical protein